MTLRARLTVALLAIACVLMTPLVIALRSLDALHTATERLSTHEFAASLLIARMRGATDELRSRETEVGVTGDSASVKRMVAASTPLATLPDSLRYYGLNDVALVVDSALTVIARAAPREFGAALSGHMAAADTIADSMVRPAISAIDRALLRAERSVSEQMQARVTESARASGRANQVSAAALLAAVLFAAAIAVWLTRSVSGPVFDLERGMEAVADGRFDYRLSLDVGRHDEFGRLAASYESMASQLAALDRMKAEFVSIASHELKTPLNVILGYVQLLEEGVFGELTAKQLEICRTLTTQGRTLSRIVNQLLDISRFRAGAGRLETRTVHLQPFLDELERSFRVLALQREIKFDVERGDGLPEEVCWDPDRMNEVLGNLLSNAFKFTERGGRVELVVRRGDGGLRMHVRDTGAGIPTDQLPYIFKKFYQASNQSKASAKGTGLGLAIASEIVNAHGGTITVESTPGVGTTFTITVPIRVESGRRVLATQREPELAHT